MAKNVRKTAVKKTPVRRVTQKAAEALRADRTQTKIRSRPKIISVVEVEDEIVVDGSAPIDLFSTFENRINIAFERNVEAQKRLAHVIAPVLVSTDCCVTEGVAGECERTRLERLVDAVVERINESSCELESLANRVRM